VAKVFRVEHRECGEGPYRSDVGGSDNIRCLTDHNYDTGHPSPWSQGWDGERDQVFGFRSLEDLTRWFDDGCHAELAEHDYVIRVYEAPRIDWRSPPGEPQQCTFVREESLRLRTLEFHELNKEAAAA
jgi:hypothetical protein